MEQNEHLEWRGDTGENNELSEAYNDYLENNKDKKKENLLTFKEYCDGYYDYMGIDDGKDFEVRDDEGGGVYVG